LRVEDLLASFGEVLVRAVAFGFVFGVGFVDASVVFGAVFFAFARAVMMGRMTRVVSFGFS
jgi:predicted membrane protein